MLTNLFTYNVISLSIYSLVFLTSINFSQYAFYLTFNVGSTLSERTADEIDGTSANRIVIDDAALGSQAASSETGIYALLIAASFVLRTVRVDDTLGSTCRWITEIALDASTYCLAIYGLTLTVRPARRWRARIYVHLDI